MQNTASPRSNVPGADRNVQGKGGEWRPAEWLELSRPPEGKRRKLAKVPRRVGFDHQRDIAVGIDAPLG